MYTVEVFSENGDFVGIFSTDSFHEALAKFKSKVEEMISDLYGVVFLSCSGGIIMEFHCDSSLIPEDIK